MSEPSRIRTALRGFSVSTALRMARLLVSLALTAWLARYLGKEGFGQLMPAMALVAVLLCVSELGFNRITVRELLRDEEASWQTLGATFYSRLMTGGILWLGLVGYVWIARPDNGLLLLIYGSLLLTHAGGEVMSWFESKNRVERVAMAQFAGFAVSAVCIAVGLWVQAPLWYFALTHNIECWFALGTVMLVFHRMGGRMKPWRWSCARAVGLIRESKFELASQLALLLLFRLDTIMVEALRGEGEAGIYGAAVRVSEVVYFIPTILSSVCLPPLLQLRSSDMVRYHQRFAEYFAMSLVIAVPCAAFLAFASPLVVTTLFGRDFSASGRILMVHAWSFIPYAIGIARTQYLTAEGRLWVNFPSVLLALAVNVLLNWLWIPAHGGEGAAWATLLAYSIAWVATSFVMPGARDVGQMIVRSVAQLPSFMVNAWKHFRVSAAARG